MTRKDDPLVFTQELCKKYNVDFTTGKKFVERSENAEDNEVSSFLEYELDREKHSMGLSFSLYDSVSKYPSQPNRIKPGLHEYLNGRKALNGILFDDFDINKNSFKGFAPYRRNIGFSFYYYLQTGKDEIPSSPGIHFHLAPSIDGSFKLGYNPMWHDEHLELNEIAEKAEGDYRPIMQRAFELFTDTPNQLQLNQIKIKSRGNISAELGIVIDQTIGILFAGEEREKIERQIKEARLKMRNQWQSVPRLNLGPIQLPTPGQKNVLTDEFVRDNSPYLVEYLATLGVMSVEEAEQLVARKLTHHIIHNSEYQLSRQHAHDIVRSLKSPKKRSKQEVA